MKKGISSVERGEIKIHVALEVDLSSESDMLAVRSQLLESLGEEATDQLIFVLKSFQQDDFVNQCDKATGELGHRLNEQFGGEESFFELVPQASYSDARSYAPLSKYGFTGKHHSVGLIRNEGDGKPASIIVDLTHFTVNGTHNKKNAVLIMKVLGSESEALRALNEKYGGDWQIDLRLDLETNEYKTVD